MAALIKWVNLKYGKILNINLSRKAEDGGLVFMKPICLIKSCSKQFRRPKRGWHVKCAEVSRRLLKYK